MTQVFHGPMAFGREAVNPRWGNARLGRFAARRLHVTLEIKPIEPSLVMQVLGVNFAAFRPGMQELNVQPIQFAFH